MSDTFAGIIKDFESYARNLRSRREEIPYELRTSIIREIYRTNSIDTGRFWKAVDYREESGVESYNYVIDASRDSKVIYDDIVERGRKDTNKYPGRLNYLKGIQKADLSRFFDTLFTSSFAR